MKQALKTPDSAFFEKQLKTIKNKNSVNTLLANKEVVVFMSDDVPRRLRRFHRDEIEVGQATGSEGVAESLFNQLPSKTNDEDVDKDVTMHLTLQEVRKFKETHKRYPKKEEYDQRLWAQNVIIA